MVLSPGDKNKTARGSILDRLIDDEDAPRAHALSIADLRNSVRRDLEMLLNTRRRATGWPSELTELGESVFSYGLPDLLAMDLAAEEDREAFMQAVAQIIRQYDPRFHEIRTQLLQNIDELDRTLRFRIEAVVRVAPSAEQIVFDSIVDPATKNITIRSR